VASDENLEDPSRWVHGHSSVPHPRSFCLDISQESRQEVKPRRERLPVSKGVIYGSLQLAESETGTWFLVASLAVVSMGRQHYLVRTDSNARG
jgi:hypothetical protein